MITNEQISNAEHVDFEDLKGLTITKVEMLISDAKWQKNYDNQINQVLLTMSDGSRYLLYHEQDCCEDVYLEQIIGYPEHLIGSEILEAKTESDEFGDMGDDVTELTFHHVKTAKGTVVFKWNGSSNGYYNMGVWQVKLREAE